MPESSSLAFLSRVSHPRGCAVPRLAAVTKRGNGRARNLHGLHCGFTLIELLLAMAIVAVLAGIVLGAGRRAVEQGRIARAQAELAVVAAALESYRLQQGDFPRTDDGAMLLQALIGRRGPGRDPIESRAFLELARFEISDGLDPQVDARARLTDPWGQPYVYAYRTPPSNWANPGYVLYSKGPDAEDAGALETGGWPNPADLRNGDNVSVSR